VRQPVGWLGTERLFRKNESSACGARERLPRITQRGIGDDDRRVGVSDDVLELGRGMRDGQRHGHAARAPDAALDRRVRKARRHQKRDARLMQIVVIAEQLSSNALRCRVELIVRVGATIGDDRGAWFHRSIIQLRATNSQPPTPDDKVRACHSSKQVRRLQRSR
jgi:hypothetical protein